LIPQIERLKDNIELSHRCRAEHVRSAPLREMSGGKILWEGVVEVFELVGHAQAKCCYAWSYLLFGHREIVTVLQIPPIDSPQKAVRAAIATGLQR
jgi:hypothetical protein